MLRTLSSLVAVLFMLGAGVYGVSGQEGANWNPTKFHATRAELKEALSLYEDAARSNAYSSALRARAHFEAALIKVRLAEGDFQIGDRISMAVEGEPTLSSDTIVVGPQLVATLPTGDTVSLKGVLRSEVNERLHDAMARVVKSPVVRSQLYLRVTVMGAVGSPGFHVVRSDALITDVLSSAGGPASGADLNDIRIERQGERIWDGDPLQEAIIQGRTVDQLNLRAGDQIYVPAQSATPGGGVMGWLRNARTLLVLLPLLFAAARKL